MNSKDSNSSFFSDCKVKSCARVTMRAGRAVALSYFPRSKSITTSAHPAKQSSYSHEMHRVRPSPHAGMGEKPLGRYSPFAYRSRLRDSDFVKPYKNASSIVLGDRSVRYARQYVTMAQNLLRAPRFEVRTNPGIISEKTKWTKHMELL